MYVTEWRNVRNKAIIRKDRDPKCLAVSRQPGFRVRKSSGLERFVRDDVSFVDLCNLADCVIKGSAACGIPFKVAPRSVVVSYRVFQHRIFGSVAIYYKTFEMNSLV